MVKKNNNQDALKVIGQTILNGRSVDFASYRPQDNETVYSLWLKFKDKTTVGAIKTINGLQTNDLTGVRVLKIPLVL
ncbi:LysM peptidoglycan-binding domain-containing protein [Lentilactobacillus sp. SPB1-3]|uniref:LysM peptidoglycan-binding domain-containing protein n=1 Tax=Lentilactobacillus terminaliae TaxID=3003483 RepID=A0ACD5DDJ2_9LACO|nr:LysM peptidoglycan-binding domain-containing protein [Lentilactobacillus sp. SPB1-3]MCZ0978087.1 LysM peptidoglycan-binding domain-containing protein [Lentilactobacillus sp. SPB1-3]